MHRNFAAFIRVLVISSLVLAPQMSLASGSGNNSNNNNSNNSSSYGRDGYDKNGYDRDGYNRNGYDRNGRDRDGYDRNGHGQNGQGHDDKVTICHKPDHGSGNTITVSQNAVPAHLNHGDSLGACSASPSQ